MPPRTPRLRSRTLTTVVATIHAASRRPKLTIGVHLPAANGSSSAVTRLTASAHLSRCQRSGSVACFHRASGPTPIRNTSGVISGTNTVSKYGGPTEILPRLSASRNSG